MLCRGCPRRKKCEQVITSRDLTARRPACPQTQPCLKKRPASDGVRTVLDGCWATRNRAVNLGAARVLYWRTSQSVEAAGPSRAQATPDETSQSAAGRRGGKFVAGRREGTFVAHDVVSARLDNEALQSFVKVGSLSAGTECRGGAYRGCGYRTGTSDS